MLRSFAPSGELPSKATPSRAFFALILFAATAFLAGCGDGNGESTADAGPSLLDDARARAEAAGQNCMKLKEYRDWLDSQIEVAGDDRAGLVTMRETASERIVAAFTKLARTSNAKAVTQLVDWAEPIVEADKGKPDAERDGLGDRLRAPLKSLYRTALRNDQSRDDLRRKLGFRELDVELGSFLQLEYIDEDDDIKSIEKMQADVADNVEVSPSGSKWLPPHWKGHAKLDELVKLVAARKEHYDKRMKDPWEGSAHKVFEMTEKSLADDFNASYEWIERTHKPYVFLIEKDKAWDETKVGKEKAEQLHELLRVFYEEYKDILNLDPIKVPVPVVVFKRHAAYLQYAVKKGMGGGVLGHFEHGTNRLYVSDETDRDTLFHEGTHQLIAFNTDAGGSLLITFGSRSYWFQEGVAEFFGGTHITHDKETNAWKYELGLLHIGRLGYWRNNAHKAYKLWDLLEVTYADRNRNKEAGDNDLNLMVYSQGWFLIYFLNNYNVDAEGVIDLKKPGKYREQWHDYLRGELKGRTGREFFLKCMGMWKNGAVDQEKFDELERELNEYFEWMNRKTSMKYHVKDKKIVPWFEVENSRGKKIGEKDDDRIVLE